MVNAQLYMFALAPMLTHSAFSFAPLWHTSRTATEKETTTAAFPADREDKKKRDGGGGGFGKSGGGSSSTSSPPPAAAVRREDTRRTPLKSVDYALRGDSVDVDAVDLAQVAPAWYTPADYPRIRFHSGVRMESLPFPDGHFTLIVSQFGFEYAQREPALRECLRVLAPGGRLAFVMHHAGSVLAKVGRSELAIHERLLEAGGLLDAARECQAALGFLGSFPAAPAAPLTVNQGSTRGPGGCGRP